MSVFKLNQVAFPAYLPIRRKKQPYLSIRTLKYAVFLPIKAIFLIITRVKFE
jgi:hypothetical protein